MLKGCPYVFGLNYLDLQSFYIVILLIEHLPGKIPIFTYRISDIELNEPLER